MRKLDGMESPEESPVPLAWDSAGEPFDPPRGAVYWRVRRVLPRGGLQVVKIGPSRPLLLKLTATEDDAIGALTELRQPNGRYRLDPVDSQGRTCGAVHTILDYQRPADSDDNGRTDDEGASATTATGGDTDKVVIDSLLGTIKELAAANASTAARIGEALAMNAHQNGGDKLGGFVEGFARLVSLANESAAPREILVQQPHGVAGAHGGAAEQGSGTLGAIVPHLGPVVAAKAGDFVDALINKLRQPSTPSWPQPRNGFAPALSVPWPPPPAFRFAASSSSAADAPPPAADVAEGATPAAPTAKGEAS